MTRPDWDEIWANFANQIARRSPDPKHKVGAIIVNEENTQFSFGILMCSEV